jgi:hypothetical protein
MSFPEMIRLKLLSDIKWADPEMEGRKITHHSSRLGLIGWTGSIQIFKTIHHKMCNTNNVHWQLPHELLHELLHGHNFGTKQSRISVPNRLRMQ